MAIALATARLRQPPRPEAPVMRIRLTRTLSLLPLLAAPLAACHGDPIDPANLADLAALHAREIVHQSGDAALDGERDGR